MTDQEYFQECLAESFAEHGVAATPEQIAAIASDVAGASENKGMYFGHDAIPNPFEAEQKRMKANHERDLAEKDRTIAAYKNEACRIAGVDPHDVWERDGEVWRTTRSPRS